MNKPLIHRGHVLVPADNRIATILPHAQVLEHEGTNYAVVPHRLDEARLLRNLGHDVPPPILSNYDWCNSTPFDAQRITAALITMNLGSFILNDLGTGKTRSALFAYDYLQRVGDRHRMLIISPLSTIRQTWQREISLVFPHLSVQVLHGSAAKRIEALAKPASIYVMNHDGVMVDTFLDALLKRCAPGDIDMLVLDELTVYKEPRTQRWKRTRKIVERISHITGMTGTPVPNAPTDAYGQIKLVAPHRYKKSFVHFRDEVMRKVTQFKWVARDGAIDTVFGYMQPSVRFLRDECYDLPPCQYVTREAQLSPEQERMYKAMAQELAVSAGSGNIKAVNAADQLNKLVQISLGTVYTTDKQVVHLPCANRLSVLEEAIEQSAAKVIVFTPYKASLRALAEVVGKRWSYGVVSGDVAPGERERIFTAFMNSPDPHVILAHPECMSHGLTLTAASTIVWYGPPLSLEMYQQANGRITRAGQRHSQLIVNIAGTRVESRIYERLNRRAELQNLLLELFEQQELEELL